MRQPLPRLAPIRHRLAAQLSLVEKFSARREAYLASRRMDLSTDSVEEMVGAEVREDNAVAEEDD